MAKITARNAQFFVGHTDFTGRTNSISMSMTAEAPDVTTFKSDVRERLADGLKDAELTGGGFYDVDNVDAILSPLLSGSTTYGFYPSTASGGFSGYEMGGVLSEYSSDFATPDAAMITFNVSASGDIIRGLSFGYAELNGVVAGVSGSGYIGGTACSIEFDSNTTEGEFVVRIATPAISTSSFGFSGSFQHSSNDSVFVTLNEFTIPNDGYVYREQFSSACTYRRIKYIVSGTGTWTAEAHAFAGSKIS